MRYDLEGIEKIAVIGAGLMGHGIAQCFAVKGYSVKLMDLQEEVLSSVLENIKGNLKLFVQNGIGSSDQIEPVLARISTTSNLKEAVTGVQFVVEAVTEDLETKQALFQRLDELCPQETILATNTSVISISEIAEPSNHKKRIVGTHFWNPPYLVPLVEVIKGQETAPQVIEVTVELLRQIGPQMPMLLAKAKNKGADPSKTPHIATEVAKDVDKEQFRVVVEDVKKELREIMDHL